MHAEPLHQNLSAKSALKEDQLEWWKDARFGMFIHWGPVCLKGTEIGWSRGREIPVVKYMTVSIYSSIL